MPNDNSPIIELKNATKVIENGEERKVILDDVSLKIYAKDFITILGGNGAGKSTLFNAISGTLSLTSGSVFIKGNDVTNHSPEKRAAAISRVFQDPKVGTAPRMTVAENIAIAALRGQRRSLRLRNITKYKGDFASLAEQIGNGLEKHLDTPTGNLSGGQRQALSLLMATIVPPDLLLLDEHTAALDPKTSVALMQLTDDLVTSKDLTALMITHHMEDALKYGNRLIVMKDGKIVQDLATSEKEQMKLEDFYRIFD
ncbi:MAG: ATP-binding cassette domain-containing protein [Lactococcus raffinolactis]|jgi:putative tryptophan/tyrosine transport system ATP-binding protein|uniref:ATP-binding cassette domain-containing protein n=1 Tax=Pseudolactococcus raffinolactis TaxID=1366 RepID=A0AAE6YNG4_9LACT|nr:ATP-binding cassette domain-containing protein [Lactococcus raffinolactis]MBW9330200.1 ATP-binding cassette domain-containing protein [Lactococcus raffinolactis]MDN5415530.1 ATP-binding cassette domain-containing protein [Lactococcus raffinolactis]MDN5579729.1 ATP-binding cassette domain-containing protein [Lactococcus raffinolactis]MDN6036639.1 ATP-binding cassette domain-containing protein [Lactococcus raffinolactis]MDN6045343.1 ATP-binding cassette domain-containing protein [Lactococcus 